MFSKIKVAYCQFQLDRLELHTEEIHKAHRKASCGYYDAVDKAKQGRFVDADTAFRVCADTHIKLIDCEKREKDHLARICNLRRRISTSTSSRVGMADAALLQ